MRDRSNAYSWVPETRGKRVILEFAEVREKGSQCAQRRMKPQEQQRSERVNEKP
jgi:hypothetical protein